MHLTLRFVLRLTACLAALSLCAGARAQEAADKQIFDRSYFEKYDLVSAEGSWYLWQPCTIDNVPVWLTGTYFDRYVKEDGVWKFSEVHLTPLTIAPFDEGWVKRPFVGE